MSTTMSTKIQKIRDAMNALNVPCYHYFAPSSQKAPYIVWYEEGEASSLEADTIKAEQAIFGYVEYFTQTEYDTVVDSIQTALNGVDHCAWQYDSVIYGDPTNDDNNTIHHSWSWEVA